MNDVLSLLPHPLKGGDAAFGIAALRFSYTAGCVAKRRIIRDGGRVCLRYSTDMLRLMTVACSYLIESVLMHVHASVSPRCDRTHRPQGKDYDLWYI